MGFCGAPRLPVVPAFLFAAPSIQVSIHIPNTCPDQKHAFRNHRNVMYWSGGIWGREAHNRRPSTKSWIWGGGDLVSPRGFPLGPLGCIGFPLPPPPARSPFPPPPNSAPPDQYRAPPNHQLGGTGIASRSNVGILHQSWILARSPSWAPRGIHGIRCCPLCLSAHSPRPHIAHHPTITGDSPPPKR